jgi:hypothetical protein
MPQPVVMQSVQEFQIYLHKRIGTDGETADNPNRIRKQLRLCRCSRSCCCWLRWRS